MIMAITTIMKAMSSPMANSLSAVCRGVIPALSGDPLVGREAELEIPKLRQADWRVDPGSEAGMTPVVTPGERDSV